MATPAISLPQLTEQELKDRRYAIDSALGTILAEGVSPGPKVLALSEKYAAGEISLQEFSSAVRAMSGL